MTHPIIEVRHIGKKYNITHQRGKYIALRDVLMNILRSPFAFLESKARRLAGREGKEDFWALKDVNFSVQKGEVVGIIGGNGAGKSTLLKILSQITPPTEGEVKIRGRVGSLLEVGTGFHPELTGRENIFLNGAILGMKQKEIAAKFDEIVAFSGVEKFLDTPVKHYSSGMYVRLAFSVAAHMEPDILIIDEVLAVGDAEFQKKCLGKMEEITQGEGKTILFVSHNLSAIQQLCDKTILLKKGTVEAFGETTEVIETYLKTAHEQKMDLRNYKRRGDGRILLTSFHVEDEEGTKVEVVKSGSNITCVIGYTCKEPENIKSVDIGFSLHRDGVLINKYYSSYAGIYFSHLSTHGQFRLTLKNIPLNSGTYQVGLRVLADNMEADWPQGDVGPLIVTNEGFENQHPASPQDGYLLLSSTWKMCNLDNK